jgi:hypothetical protein
MKNLKMQTVLALFVCLSFLLVVKAQEKIANVPTGLALKITFLKTSPPAFQSIGAKDSKANWSWYSRFGQINGWQLSPGQLPVKAVKIVSQLENDNSAKIIVSVITGQKLHEKEDPVAELRLRENESAVVNELKQFGVEPFVIDLARVTPSVADLPAIINKTNSLSIVSIEPVFSTLPSFKVRIQNLSNKNVKALFTEVTVEGRTAFTGMPQGREAEALIDAGETYDLIMRNAQKSVKTDHGYKTELQQNQTLFIRSAIFDDGSFEGDARPAAQFRSFVLGRKLQLKAIIRLLDEALTSEKSLKQLETEITNLPVQPDQAAFKTLTDVFPGFSEKEKSDLRTGVEIAMQGVKKSTLDELMHFQRTELPGDLKTQQNLLKTIKERYQEWLSNLK